MPIEIISDLVPKNGENFPTHSDIYGKGGFMAVSTLSDRDTIPALRRKVGMVVNVVEEGVAYQLDSDMLSWSVFNTGGGGGGIPDVPEDGIAYLRKDSAWVPISDYTTDLDEGLYA